MNADAHTLTGAYALDALGDHERRRFERHLAECLACAQEVAEFRATTARLAVAATEQPPASLRANVLAEISRTRQEPPTAFSSPSRRGRLDAHRGWASRVTAVAAGIALVAAVALGALAYRAQQQLQTAQAQLAQTEARNAPIAAVLAAPDASTSSGAGTAGPGNATVVASRQLNQAVLAVSGMPRLDTRHDYQVWLMGPGQPRPAGLLRTDPDTRMPPLVLSDLANAAKIGVTVEQAGGVGQPTTSPVLLLDLPA